MKKSYQHLVAGCVQSNCEASDDVSLTSHTSDINLHYNSANHVDDDDDDDGDDDKVGVRALVSR